jgi:hypothetical protein
MLGFMLGVAMVIMMVLPGDIIGAVWPGGGSASPKIRQRPAAATFCLESLGVSGPNRDQKLHQLLVFSA